MPLANSFLTKDELESPELSYPLDVCFCNSCHLVQLADVVPPEILFKDYIYVSGTSNTLRAHFEGLAIEVVERFGLNSESLAIDIGSNDGTLLRCFQNLKTKTLGIEPAANLAKLARERGIDTIDDFFGMKTAERIRGETKVGAILATNVFAHVDDLDDFVRGVNVLLDDEGVFVIEVPYLVDMLQKMLFDTIYHEHLSYFALEPLVTLFERIDMKVLDVKRVDSHGGSIRIFVVRSSSPFKSTESVARLLQIERRLRLGSLETYLDFASQVKLVKEKLVSMLKRFKSEGKNIVGYGAPAKGNTLLNFCGIGNDILDYIVDESPLKQGLYTPGVHVPVLPTRQIRIDSPDYALLLAWNYAAEILEREREYRQAGGKFIVPIPEPRIT
jgi:SAM-dependent methyltransferase